MSTAAATTSTATTAQKDGKDELFLFASSNAQTKT